MRHLLVCFFLGLLTTTAFGGKYNEKLDYLSEAPSWKELPGVDGKKHSLSDLEDKEIIVVAFTCNSCPYAVDYEQRLIDLAKQYGGKDGKVGVVAINVNLIPEDSLEAMTSRAKEKQYPFTYLFDETQKIAKEYGAFRTPEFFVLNKKRQVVYMGAFDDNTTADKVTKNYVTDAIAAALSSKKPDVVETVSIGCAIRYKSERRRRRSRKE